MDNRISFIYWKEIGTQSESKSTRKLFSVGILVRTGLQAGNWNCTACEGEVMGSQLFKPTCSYCQQI